MKMERPNKEPVKEKKEERFEMAQIATQTDNVIRDSETDEYLDIKEAIMKTLNGIEEIKKALA